MTNTTAQQPIDRSSLLPFLWKKPKVLSKWLYQSREMQLVFALLLLSLLVPLLLPYYLDPLLQDLFPPVAKKRMLGLVSGGNCQS